MVQQRSVGLIIMTEVPDVGLMAVLRERGWFNFETMKPESWPGGCQVTVHGKLENGEDFLTALDREMNEELGPAFATLSNMRKGIVPVFEQQNESKHVKTFAQMIDFFCLPKIRLSPDSGSIRFVTRQELDSAIDIATFRKSVPVPVRRIIAMFPDEKKAVADAFDRLKPLASL